MKFKWWIEPNNFGDVLSPNVLDHFDIPFTYVDRIEDAEAICIGSIARLALSGQKVFGSGRIRKNENLNPDAEWLFVRGPLTRERVIECGGDCPEIYGDPALLLPDFCEPLEKKYKVGYVPHYQDYYRFKAMYPNELVINVVNKDPIKVAKQISSCERIVSSSLHGIIVAHAYDIPASWVEWSKLHGDGTKFQDYFLSVGLGKRKPNTNNYIEPGEIDLDPIRKIFKEQSIALRSI